ncbi:MAG: hypothetical protein A2X22_04165 [Bacteroidetes bacterium GWF2_49_14]|nr:MAG: hypothetical protein A2X22_04165 [Bacteroidetes bacterium GWF2_49_14]
MDLPIRKELFWDINAAELDPVKHRRLIIERVFSLGTLDELRVILQFYGKEIIREEIMKVGYLDPKTFSFVVSYLKIPKTKMTCYIRKQLRPQHWT